MRFCCFFLIPLLMNCTGFVAHAAEDESIRVMSFNLWVGTEGALLPMAHTANVIRVAKADIVGVQEAYGRKRGGVAPDRSKELAEMLGWNHVDQGDGKTILTRFEIIGLSAGKQGAAIRLPSGRAFHLFNVHLFHAPYQPYQLLKIPYEEAPFLDTAEELIAAARAARGPELQRALDEIAPLLAKGEAVALTGDFNEPSHLDWTLRAAATGVVPMAVEYPASKAATDLGLVDTFRAVYPDETARKGYTWTPTTREDDPKDRHDRIDFVYAGPGIEIAAAAVVGEKGPRTDFDYMPWPSDHRAVVATLRLKVAPASP